MATAAFTFVRDGLKVTFSIGSDVGDEAWWDLGDGSFRQGANVIHFYTQDGTYSAALTVIDSEGADTVEHDVVVSASSESTVVMEFDDLSFPIEFGHEGTPYRTRRIDYKGSWEARPKVTLTGPFSSATVLNTATGISFTWAVPVPAGQTRMLYYDHDQGWQVVDDDGNDRSWELTLESNYFDFRLLPSNLIPQPQYIEAYMYGVSDDTLVEVDYEEVYF